MIGGEAASDCVAQRVVIWAPAQGDHQGRVMGYVDVKSSLLIAFTLASGELCDKSEMKQVFQQ